MTKALLFFLTVAWAPHAAAVQNDPSAFLKATEQAPDGWLVDLADDADAGTIAAIAQKLAVKLGSPAALSPGKRLEIGHLSRAMVSWLKKHPEVESVEPNQILGLFQEAPADPPTSGKIKNPNDPMYKSQWHFDMIHLESAWEHSAGDEVVVAVVDTGVSFGKLDGKKSQFARVPDLRQTQFVAGYNFVDNNDDPSDDHGHGTHVAGTIAQSTNNDLGVAGIAPRAAIMPIKVLAKSGGGSLGGISKGIRWAADHGANVINLSLGGGFYSPTMHKAIKYAYNKGVTLVCAAGNTGRARVEYPARYPECVAVSSVGPDGKLAFYSSHGKELEIAAPGGDTRVDLNNDGIPDGVLQNTIAIGDPTQHGYFPFQGTSMAAPHVAGIAALLYAAGITDPDAITQTLANSADKRDETLKYGAGLLDGGNAFQVSNAQKATYGFGFALMLGLLGMARLRNGRMLFSTGPALLLLYVGGAFTFMLPEAFTSPLGWAHLAIGPQAHFHPVSSNFLWVLLPSLMLWGVKSARTYLAAFSIGAAAYFLSQSFLGHVDVPWISGHGFTDAAWLFANGALSWWWGRFLLRHLKG